MPFILEITLVNLYGSIIDADRFRKERNFARMNQLESCSSVENPDLLVTTTQSNPKTQSNWFIKWMDYHNYTWRQLIVPVVTFGVMIFHIIKDFIYLSFPLDLKPETMEYSDPTLEVLTRYYLGDILKNFNNNYLTHLIGMILLLNQVIIMLVSLYSLYIDARLNGKFYHKINILQLELNSVFMFAGTIRDWRDFIGFCWRHRCDFESYNAKLVFEASKHFTKSIEHLSRIDRLIYYNQIDFSFCYHKSPVKLIEEHELNRIDKVATLMAPRKGFCPTPKYRLDPRDLLLVLILGYTAIISLFFVILLITPCFILIIIGPVDSGSSISEYLNNIVAASNSYIMVQSVEAILVTICTANNVLHVIFFVYANTVYQSRSRRVNRLLDIQCKLLISYRRKFVRELSNRLVKYQYDQYIDEIFWLEYNRMEENFVPFIISPSLVQEFNDNLRHILALSNVLEGELLDMRTFFHVYMNLYVLSGALVISLGPKVFDSAANGKEVLIVVTLYLAAIVPLLYTLILAATVESAVSIIYNPKIHSVNHIHS